MRIAVIIIAGYLMAPNAVAQQGPNEAVMIGPWKIEAIMKGRKFDNCSMSRTANDVNVTILRASDGLTMVLDSPKMEA